MYLEMERRSQAQQWVGGSQSTPMGKKQPIEATGCRHRDVTTPAQAPETEFGPGYDEARGLRGKLRVLTDANIALEAFNATVSHDLCTPLTVVNGYCQVLKELCGDQLDANAKGYVQEIYQGTLRMQELIASMLNLSRITQKTVHREQIDLSRMANLVAQEQQLAEPKRCVTLLCAKGITVNGHPGFWRCVLDNLIGNAWKHGANAEKTFVAFGQTRLAGKTVYFVRDNGPGFEMTQADRLFLPFQRMPGTEAEGHGIGLATVDRIVRRNGGRVWVKSAPGAGATFYFTME